MFKDGVCELHGLSERDLPFLKCRVAKTKEHAKVEPVAYYSWLVETGHYIGKKILEVLDYGLAIGIVVVSGLAIVAGGALLLIGVVGSLALIQVLYLVCLHL